VLGVSDVIQINVWEQRDLSTEATIRPDGTITMPLVGDLPARGKTPSQLRDVIKAALQNFLKLQAGNEVTVSVKTYNSYAFTVNGEVSRPGMYTSTKYLRAADAIALAGGPTRFAKRSDIRILRVDSKGDQISIPIDFDLVASGKRPDMNIWIMAEDVIYIP
jgi:polysaccharide export outer membrane protein